MDSGPDVEKAWDRGVVVAPEPRAAEVGADILHAGGNAFDAAVATAFAQMVYSPFMCGLGGWGAATMHHAATGNTSYLPFLATVGSGMRPDMWADQINGYTDMWHIGLVEGHKNLMGYGAIMTPGVVAGLGKIQEQYGRLPWNTLLEPSIVGSDEGYAVTEQIASAARNFAFPGMPSVEEQYCWSQSAKDLWLRADGSLVQPGDRYRNPDQARVLERLGEAGPRDFYVGDIAQTINEDFEKNHAYVTADDLAGYQAIDEPTLTSTYRGYELASSAPPSGGLLLLHMLKVLEHFDLRSMEHNGPEHAFLIGGAMAWAGVIRFRHLADPRHHEVPVDWLLSEEYAEDIAERLRRRMLPEVSVLNAPGGTTHLSAVDREGNCVTLTHTLTLPSGVVIPGTGFTWNGCVSLMDPEPGRVNSLVPGRSRASAVSPTIVSKDQSPHIVIGSPGGYSISGAVLQGIVNMLDFDMSPTEAVVAPRLHSEGKPVFAEGRISQRTLRALNRAGMKVVQRPISYVSSFGRLQAIRIAGGYVTAAADPRNDGGAPFFA